MSSYSPDSLKTEIDAGRMRVGNQVQSAAGAAAATSVSQLTADASSNLQTTSHLPVVQPSTTAVFFDLTATANQGILTQTFVRGADVTTATIGGYARVAVTDTAGNITTGNYYIPFYTIT